MDSSIITPVAALVGSLAGASASIVMNWMPLRSRLLLDRAIEERRRRQLLYEEFIRDASNSLIDALSHSLDEPEKVVKLYSNMSCIRLLASAPVLAAAEKCCEQIVELYYRPNMTIDEIRESFRERRVDTLREFSAACRAELHEIGPGGVNTLEWE